MKVKVVYLISDINKAIAFEWIAKRLPVEKFQLYFLLLNPGSSELEKFLINNNTHVQRIPLHGKLSYLSAFFKVISFLFKQKPDLIHCHLFEASLLGLLAAKLAGIKKRIYTRHHSTFNWEYNLKGIKYDRWINSLATHIIAISENVKNVLIKKEEVKSSKITLIHHGFDLNAFIDIDLQRINSLDQKYNPKKKQPVIGIIARWIEWKGIQYIIPAFKQLLLDYPDALLVLANANGSYKTKITALLSDLPENSYRIILFENDLFALYQLFDVYVHTPNNQHIEAFGQTYIEALASGIPSIFTLSGVAPEFIEHEKNALVVPFKDSEAIYTSMIKLLKDRSLKENLIKNGNESVQTFELQRMIHKLENLYLS